MILYVLLVLALASFVIAFFSARTWHWAYVLVVEALFLATAGFFILTSEVTRINGVFRAEIKRLQGDEIKGTPGEIGKVEEENVALREGTNNATVIGRLTNAPENPVKTTKNPEGQEIVESLPDLNSKLLIATRIRGQVWRGAAPTGQPNAQTGAVNVGPLPGIKTKTVVYVFEDPTPAADGSQRGAQYIGDFTVTQAGAQTTLQPAHQTDQFERTRLSRSRGPWVIYETMPLDRHEIFAGKSDQELKQKLPPKSLSEYVRDYKPATPELSRDEPDRVVGLDENGNRLPPKEIGKAVKKVYQRRLRDYASDFDELIRRRVATFADIDAVKRDIDRLKAAQEVANHLKAFREDEQKKLTSDLAGINKERDAIQKHLEQVNKLLARARDLTAELMHRNDQMAAELAARQLQSRRPGNGATTPVNAGGPLALGVR
jgi:hypothetical protein